MVSITYEYVLVHTSTDQYILVCTGMYKYIPVYTSIYQYILVCTVNALFYGAGISASSAITSSRLCCTVIHRFCGVRILSTARGSHL